MNDSDSMKLAEKISPYMLRLNPKLVQLETVSSRDIEQTGMKDGAAVQKFGYILIARYAQVKHR